MEWRGGVSQMTELSSPASTRLESESSRLRAEVRRLRGQAAAGRAEETRLLTVSYGLTEQVSHGPTAAIPYGEPLPQL